jgi:LPS sulfotransferase NodH
LCEGLSATGIAGIPQEYAAPEDISIWHDFHGCSTHAEYFFRFPELCKTSNGVFGAKLMWLQYMAWGRDARYYLRSGMSTPDIIRRMTGRLHVIRLMRRDNLRQAISWVRAQSTGIWSRRQGDPIELGDTRPPKYDVVALRQALLRLKRQNQNWDALLPQLNAPTVTVFYEDLAATYRTTVAEVLDFIGLPWNAELPEPKLKPQADEITEEWVERARYDLGSDC